MEDLHHWSLPRSKPMVSDPTWVAAQLHQTPEATTCSPMHVHCYLYGAWSKLPDFLARRFEGLPEHPRWELCVLSSRHQFALQYSLRVGRRATINRFLTSPSSHSFLGSCNLRVWN